MSLIPIRFRDWWDDWDTDFAIDPWRSNRSNDLLSSLWDPQRSVFRNALRRPWGNEELQRMQADPKINVDKDKFEVIFLSELNCHSLTKSYSVLLLFKKCLLMGVILHFPDAP